MWDDSDPDDSDADGSDTDDLELDDSDADDLKPDDLDSDDSEPDAGEGKSERKGQTRTQRHTLSRSRPIDDG